VNPRAVRTLHSSSTIISRYRVSMATSLGLHCLSSCSSPRSGAAPGVLPSWAVSTPYTERAGFHPKLHRRTVAPQSQIRSRAGRRALGEETLGGGRNDGRLPTGAVHRPQPLPAVKRYQRTYGRPRRPLRARYGHVNRLVITGRQVLCLTALQAAQLWAVARPRRCE
jgi:hypothetical protein